MIKNATICILFLMVGVISVMAQPVRNDHRPLETPMVLMDQEAINSNAYDRNDDFIAEKDGITYYTGSLREAQTEALAAKKLIFIYVAEKDNFESWYTERKTLRKNSLTTYLNTFCINLHRFSDNPEIQTLIKENRISKFPTAMIMTPKGEVVEFLQGPQSTAAYLQAARDGLKQDRTMRGLMRDLEDHKNDAKHLYELGAKLKRAGQPYDNVTRMFFSLQRKTDSIAALSTPRSATDAPPTTITMPDGSVRPMMKISKSNPMTFLYFRDVLNTTYSPYFLDLVKQTPTIRTEYGDSTMRMYIMSIISNDDDTAKRIKDEEQMAGLISNMITLFPSKTKMLSSKCYMYQTRNNLPLFIEHAKDYFAENQKDYHTYEFAAQVVMHQSEKSDTAEMRLARKWMDSALKLNRNFFNLQTYVKLMYKVGDKEEAKKAAEECYALAEKDNYLSEKIIELRDVATGKKKLETLDSDTKSPGEKKTN